MSPGQRQTIESTLPAYSRTKRFTRIRQAGERVNDLLQLTGDHAPGFANPARAALRLGTALALPDKILPQALLPQVISRPSTVCSVNNSSERPSILNSRLSAGLLCHEDASKTEFTTCASGQMSGNGPGFSLSYAGLFGNIPYASPTGALPRWSGDSRRS